MNGRRGQARAFCPIFVVYYHVCGMCDIIKMKDKYFRWPIYIQFTFDNDYELSNALIYFETTA